MASSFVLTLRSDIMSFGFVKLLILNMFLFYKLPEVYSEIITLFFRNFYENLNRFFFIFD